MVPEKYGSRTRPVRSRTRRSRPSAFSSSQRADVLLLDTGAGISDNVLQFVLAAGEALVVTTPEPTAVTDAYALIKILARRSLGAPPRLVFSTHIDTVPPHFASFEDEEYLYGRGACDAKGILATQLAANNVKNRIS